jgi:dTDP-4-amino-4,6-dideoxygalactose transaminase
MASPGNTAVVEVTYVDLGAQHRTIKRELLAAVEAVLDRGDFILGREVEEFEQRFATLCGTRHAVGVNSGTDALFLALRALVVGPGDEVIVPANSFVASASAVALSGARPVLVDVRPDYNIDPERVEAAITARTRAIVPVHLTGRPAPMDEVTAVAERHGLYVIEDAAQAALARYRDRPVGSLGTVGCFSLHPLKTLNACGDGGVLTTDDDHLAERFRVLRNIGQLTRGEAIVWSGNSRLDTVQAAMLLVKLDHAPEWTERRRANAAFYRQALAGLRGLDTPADQPWEWAVYHTFVVQSDDRDALQQHLAECGIQSGVHYPVPIHLQPAAAELGYRPGDLPETERQAARILSLPVHTQLTVEQLELVTAAVRSFVESAER